MDLFKSCGKIVGILKTTAGSDLGHGIGGTGKELPRPLHLLKLDEPPHG